MTFVPSSYQLAVFQWVREGRGDGVVSAVAGSGKSTTLVQAAKLIGGPGLFLAFNKAIVEELKGKLAGTSMTASTIHSAGRSALVKGLPTVKRLDIKSNKYRDLSRGWVDAHGASFEPQARDRAAGTLSKLVDLARLTLTPPEDLKGLEAMALHYSLDLYEAQADPFSPSPLPGAVATILSQGERLATSQGVIDFTDMIYLPSRLNLKPNQAGWVFIDECQDLSAAQLALVLKMRAPGGRMLFVGDKQQSIMGFAGADSDSFDNIIRTTGATVLPLNVCYRCPSSHLALAREIVPHIEPRPGAPEGVLSYEPTKPLTELVQERDLVLCRLTAPLVVACLGLIKSGIAARVKGRDIGRDLIALLKRVAQLEGFTWEQVGTFLEAYRAKQLAFLRQREAEEGVIQRLEDSLDAIEALIEATLAGSLEELAQRIDGLFSDEAAAVSLSTIHRAKGLEADRVIILKPEKLPLVWAGQSQWQYIQELNLKGVALTRAKQTLIICGPDPRPEPEPEAPAEEPQEAPEPSQDKQQLGRYPSRSAELADELAWAQELDLQASWEAADEALAQQTQWELAEEALAQQSGPGALPSSKAPQDGPEVIRLPVPLHIESQVQTILDLMGEVPSKYWPYMLHKMGVIEDPSLREEVPF